MIALLNLGLICRCHHITNQVLLVRALSTLQLKKYYNLLNVDKDSTSKEIKSSFLRLSKIYHPDNKETGSHTKFVQLKEAYDAVKDGPPATTTSTYSNYTNDSGRSPYSSYSSSSSTSSSSRGPSSSSSSQSSSNNNSYSNYDFYTDIKYQQAFRKDRERAYKMGYDFGGPYARSRTPWEDLLRDREYNQQKQKSQRRSSQQYKPFVHITLVFSAIAWIVIYSGFMILMDFNDYDKRNAFYKSRSLDNHLTLEEARRRRQIFEARQKSYKETRMQEADSKSYAKDDSLKPKNDDDDDTITNLSSDQTIGTLAGELQPQART